MKNDRKINLIAILFSLPWCCILPVILSLSGLIAGMAAARIWSVKVTPFLFILSLIFLIRAHWLLYIRHQGSKVSAVIVWITTLMAGFLWFFRMRYFLRVGFFLAVTSFIFTNSAFAHEPIFSLGPETIFKGGVGIETEFEYGENGEKETAIHTEILYGVTEKLSLTLGIPYLIEKEGNDETLQGLGEIEFRTKYQLFRKDTLGAQDKLTLLYGIKFPTGDEDKEPSLGSGAVDHTFGLSIGHESTTLYGFATGRYVLRTDSGGRDKGDRFLFDIAFGARPWLRPYKSWDLVLLLENNYIYSEKDEINGATKLNTGGHEILTGPTFLWSIRNLMIKGGVQFSLWEDLNGNQKDSEYHAKLAVEWHF